MLRKLPELCGNALKIRAADKRLSKSAGTVSDDVVLNPEVSFLLSGLSVKAFVVFEFRLEYY